MTKDTQLNFTQIDCLGQWQCVLINDKKYYGVTFDHLNSTRENNNEIETLQYMFFDTWDKSKNLLPKPTHEVILTAQVKKEFVVEKTHIITQVQKILKGSLLNLKTKTKTPINSFKVLNAFFDQ